MSKQKQPIGQCRLCGKVLPLTFEHVPPHGAGNSGKVRQVTGGDLLQSLRNGRDQMPWDMTGLHSRESQKGKGGYYLCQACNNNTGKWYATEYVKFVNGIVACIQGLKEGYSGVHFENCTPVYPLRVFKQIMVMMLDVNPLGLDDDNLVQFLLDKEARMFDKKKYQVYSYLYDGPIERLNGFMVHHNILTGVSYNTSEVASWPIGFTLYIDLPDGYQPAGCNITNMVDFGYDDQAKMSFYLPRLEGNTPISGDFRTKSEIIAAIESDKNAGEGVQ